MSGVDPEITLHQDGPFCYRAQMEYTADTLDAMARRAAERTEDELTQQILARLGYVRLPQRKVYLVHSESGEYSDWTFAPLAVFTTREKAVEWIEGQRVPVTRNNYYDGLTTDVWGDDKVECYARPTTTDGKTWLVRVTEDGRKVVRGYDDDAWFIDELEIDPVREEHE